VLQSVLVPPVPIRPSVAMDVNGGSNEDDLTTQLQEIVQLNQVKWRGRPDPNPPCLPPFILAVLGPEAF
jgi:DNA-directed RNA polymerase beta' subunit